MAKTRTLLFQPALAPYRLDLFNRLSQELDLTVVFLANRIGYHADVDQARLRSGLDCPFDDLDALRVLGREVGFGIVPSLRRHRPEVVVSPEFSLTSLAVRLSAAGNRGLGHVVWTSESPAALVRRRGLRLALRRHLTKAADALLVYSEPVRLGFAAIGARKDETFLCANHQQERSFREMLERARPRALDYLRKYRLVGKRVMLYVGRLAAEKNLVTLLRGFALANAGRDSVLVLVGSGAQEQLLGSEAAKLELPVIFAGHQEGQDLLAWYLAAGLLVLPSVTEPYGAVVNEALLAGVRVLCSRAAGASVLIGSGNGELFEPLDVQALAGAMRRNLLEAPPAEIAASGLRECLMPVAFERDVESFANAVACAHARGLRRASR